MAKARVHLFIEGRVQGVFYRAFTRESAARLGLNGWAKNLYDGSVEVVLEGDKGAIEEAIQECRKGPPGSSVQEVKVVWEEYLENYKGFEIKY